MIARRLLTIIKTIFLSVTILLSACGYTAPEADDLASNIPAEPPTCQFGFFEPSGPTINGVGTYRFQWAEQEGATSYILTIKGGTYFSELTSDTYMDVSMDQFTDPGTYVASVTALKDLNTVICVIYKNFKVNLGVPNCYLAFISPEPGIANIVNLDYHFDWTDQPGAALYALSITTPSADTVDYVSFGPSEKDIDLSAFNEFGEYTLTLRALKDKDTLICEITRKLFILQAKNDDKKHDDGGKPIVNPTDPPPG
jgi:hypothetical protein